MGAVVGPLITAGAELLTSGFNAISQSSMNANMRRYNNYMYDKQRANAIADWDRTNAYNSPKAQMGRFKEAGLNPNLIYGQTSEASPIKSPDAPQWNPRAPQIDIRGGEIVRSMYDLQLKDAGLDKIKAETEVIKRDALLREAQIKMSMTDEERKRFDLTLEQETRNSTVAARGLGVKKTEAEIEGIRTNTSIAIERNLRESLSNNQSIKESVERIKHSIAQRGKIPFEIEGLKAGTALTIEQRGKVVREIENLLKSGTLQDFDIDWRKRGGNPHDAGATKIVKDVADKLKGIFDHIGESGVLSTPRVKVRTRF